MTSKERLKSWLKENKITEAAFEQKAGLAKGAVSKFGESPRKDTLDKIRNAYPKLDIAWLLGIENTQNSSENTEERKTIVYHYTSLKNFMGIIGDGMFRFGSLGKSNDLRDSNNDCGYKYVSFCIGDEKSGFDKPRMWSQYGKNNDGICIGLYLDKLIEYNNGENDLEYFRVEYKEASEIAYMGNSGKDSLKVKHEDWSQENEYRFISKSLDGLKFSYDCIYCLCVGFYVGEKDMITQIGLNSKIKPLMMVSGIMKEGFISIGKKISTERYGNVVFGKISNKEDVDEKTGMKNASKFYKGLCLEESMKKKGGFTYYSEYVDGGIPFYRELPVSAGQQDLSLIQTPEEPTGWIKPAEVLTAIGAFPVRGCSMEPFIHQGDFVAVEPVEKWDRVDPDKVYMIITSYDRMIKHLMPDEENDEIIWGISPNYPRVKIYKNEIKDVFRVTFYGRLM